MRLTPIVHVIHPALHTTASLTYMIYIYEYSKTFLCSGSHPAFGTDSTAAKDSGGQLNALQRNISFVHVIYTNQQRSN